MRQKLLGIALFVLMGSAWADNDVLMDKVWLRESVPGQASASLQMNLTVTGPAKLVGVSSPWASSVQMQKLGLSRGRVKPRAVPSVRLSRNRTLVFGERSMALMMLGLRRPLQAGDHVPVKLTLEFPGRRTRMLETEAEVRPLELSYKHYGGGEVHDHQ